MYQREIWVVKQTKRALFRYASICFNFVRRRCIKSYIYYRLDCALSKWESFLLKERELYFYCILACTSMFNMCVCVFGLYVLSCADPEGGGAGGWDHPWNIQKTIGFLSITGTDPLKNHKATMPVFSVEPSSARQRNII